jgi:hypothetical protein
MGKFRVAPQGESSSDGLLVSFKPMTADDVLDAFDTAEGMRPGPLHDCTFTFESVRLLVREVRGLRGQRKRAASWANRGN